MNRHATPAELMKKWWKNSITRSSWLTSNNKSSFEPGGTMIITHSRSTAHTCSAETDRFHLGRWNAITLKGKKEYYTTIISIYRPSTYQETYLRQTAHTAKRRKVTPTLSPEDMWYIDLRDLILEKIGLGHEVLVAGDFNDDLNNERGRTRTFMTNLGLREILLEKYGKGPATYARGSTTIDGVFATANLQLANGFYVPFDKSPGDHRWMVIDLTERTLLGRARDDLSPPLLRKATSKIPSVQHKFQELVDAKILEANLHSRIHRLYKHILDGKQFTIQEAQEYETIEDCLQRSVKYADKRCRKARRGKIPFSPLQKKLMGEIIILKQLKLRMLLKGRPNRPRSKRIQRLMHKYHYSGKQFFSDIKSIEAAIQEAFQAYNSFRGNAQVSRWFYLEQIARELDEADGKGKQHHYKILHQRESTREFFRQLRFYEGKNNKGGVEKIQIEDGGQVNITYDKRRIEKEIMRVNQKKLLQASDTPLRQPPISELLGEQGDFDTWEQILSGNITLPPDVDEGLLVWYQYIINIPQHTPLDITWTTEEYVHSWKKMKEEKMTIPGIQVAHLKCLDATSPTAYIISKLALIPLMVGYSPKTWQWGIDSMIPKKVADLRPEKLRLILLMDARFNHNNKLIGKKMMEYGEANNLLAPEQFGSRHHKSAIEHAVNKRLAMDIIRQSGTDAVYVANDAKSCYDRILLIVAYLTMRKFGIPALVAKSTISTILQMKHKVRTRYGDSSRYYGGDKWDVKPHGCGQGNGYGPALWACISSPLLHIMRQSGYGTRFLSPLSNKDIHIAAFAFVDDVDIIQTQHNDVDGNMTPQQKMETLIGDTQHAVNQWASILRVTGGALEPSKTFYVPIVNLWKGTVKQVTSIDAGRQLYLQEGDGSVTLLPQYRPSEAFFSLGIWQSPSGDDTRQQEHLISKMKSWGTDTSLKKISWTHTRVAIRSTLGKTLTYSLPATSFTTLQCKELQKVLNHTILGKMGIVRTTPSLIATAPQALGGLGVFSFEVTQTIAHITMILLHGPDTSSMTHSLLLASLEYYSLESGLCGDPMRLPYVDYITRSTWIAQTLFTMRQHDIDIITGLPGVDPWCEHDIFIMDRMRYFYSTTTLLAVNKVRLYLRVVTLSDLITADGRAYSGALLKGHRCDANPSPSCLRYRWPDVPPPSQSERSTWFQCLTTVFDISAANEYRRSQSHPQWYSKSVEFAHWVYSRGQDTLYQNIGSDRWQIWIRHTMSEHGYSTRSSTNAYTASQTTESMPDDCCPASITRDRHYVRLKGNLGHLSMVAHSVSDYNSFTDDSMILDTLHAPMTAVCHYLYNIQLNNGVIVTDGSCKGTTATFAFLAQPGQQTCPLHRIVFDDLFWGSGFVEGSETETNSYRAELAGILTAITTTNTQCRLYKVESGQCTLHCDSQGALLAAFGYKHPTPRWASYDLLWKIRQAIKTSPIKWAYQHVLGHQDDSSAFETLSPITQGNIIVDYLANEAYKRPSATINTTIPWSVRIRGQLIGGNVERQLQYAIFRPLMTERWSQLFGLPPIPQHRVAWDLFYKSLATLPSRYQPFVTKYNARLLPVGTNLKRRRHSDLDTCPCCGEIEDHLHLIRCQQPQMSITYHECTEALQETLKEQMDATICLGILWLLHTFRYTTSSMLAPAPWVNDQLLLGPRAFFAGLWLADWVTIQEAYLSQIKSARSASLGLRRVIHEIQLIPYKMWQTRNRILHNINDNHITRRQHDELNNQIDLIFSQKPHSRLLAHCDNTYFGKHSMDKIKNMTLNRKRNWVAGAILIMTKYERTRTSQSEWFTSYFQWDPG